MWLPDTYQQSGKIGEEEGLLSLCLHCLCVVTLGEMTSFGNILLFISVYTGSLRVINKKNDSKTLNLHKIINEGTPQYCNILDFCNTNT